MYSVYIGHYLVINTVVVMSARCPRIYIYSHCTSIGYCYIHGVHPFCKFKSEKTLNHMCNRFWTRSGFFFMRLGNDKMYEK